MKKKTEKQKLSDKLDKLWRVVICEKANWTCEYCGKVGGLNAHHIFSRSNKNVRWDLDNGVCVCVAHHVFGNISFHKSPVEMLEWIKKKRGNFWYESLREKARYNKKMSLLKMEEIKIKLEEYLNDNCY